MQFEAKISTRLKQEIERALVALGDSVRISIDRWTFGSSEESKDSKDYPIRAFEKEVGNIAGKGDALDFWADYLGTLCENETLKTRLVQTERRVDRGQLDRRNIIVTAQELSEAADHKGIAQTLLYCVFGLMASSRGSVTIDGQLMAARGGKTSDLETLILPLEIHGKTLGQLSLGKRLSGEAYSEDDLEILAAVAHQAATSVENVSFREETLRQASELKETFESLLVALATSIDARHPLTGSHTQRVTRYAVQLAEEVGLDEAEIEIIRIASLLHDIGKIGIPDAILTKPGAFTDEEFAIMKRHAVITREILSTIRFSPSLQSVPEIAGGHHEKYNGRGYPEGLAGEDIPLGSRIIALADVYDALTSKRDYRAAMPIGQVVAILEEGTGQHFDPVLAPRFLELIRREAKEEG